MGKHEKGMLDVSNSAGKSTRRVVARYLALAGVIGPILFALGFTLAGFLRPGYSPIRQSISALGVGTNAWLGNVDAMVFAVLLLAFALGFFLSMYQMMRTGWLVAFLVLFVVSCIGIIDAAIFPAASGTAGLHWLIGFLPAFLAPVAAYLVVGKEWLRMQGWHGYGWYSLATAAGSILFILLSFALLAPRRATGGPVASVGGLVERILVLITFAWPVVIGWRLFVLAEP